jgi:hypothetical protein
MALVLLGRTQAEVATPPAGKLTLFVDSADVALKAKNSAGVVTPCTFTDELAQDAIAALLQAGTHRGISVTYNDPANGMSLDAGPAIVTLPTSATGSTLTCTGLDNRTNRTVLTGNVIFTMITLPANATLVIFYQQAATGGPFSITFPAGIIWPGGTAPTMPTTASRFLRVTLTSDGVGVHGNYSTN